MLGVQYSSDTRNSCQPCTSVAQRRSSSHPPTPVALLLTDVSCIAMVTNTDPSLLHERHTLIWSQLIDIYCGIALPCTSLLRLTISLYIRVLALAGLLSVHRKVQSRGYDKRARFGTEYSDPFATSPSTRFPRNMQRPRNHICRHRKSRYSIFGIAGI